MSEPIASITTAAASAITAGALVAAPQVVLVFGLVPTAVIYSAAFGAFLFTLKSRPADSGIKAQMVSWAIGTAAGVVLTVGLQALAGAIEMLKPAAAVPAWVLAGLFGFFGNIIVARGLKFAETAKIPGDGS